LTAAGNRGGVIKGAGVVLPRSTDVERRDGGGGRNIVQLGKSKMSGAGSCHEGKRREIISKKNKEGKTSIDSREKEKVKCENARINPVRRTVDSLFRKGHSGGGT